MDARRPRRVRLRFSVADRVVTSDGVLIGRGWGWGRADLEAVNRIDPDGFAIVEANHPTVRWVLVRELRIPGSPEKVAATLLRQFGDQVAPHGIGHVTVEPA